MVTLRVTILLHRLDQQFFRQCAYFEHHADEFETMEEGEIVDDDNEDDENDDEKIHEVYRTMSDNNKKLWSSLPDESRKYNFNFTSDLESVGLGNIRFSIRNCSLKC